jgi:hypothetical protein
MGKEGKSGAKTDDIDAFAIACWYFDKPESSYLKIRDPLVNQIKGICLRIEHLNRLQTPIVNRMRQELAWQCPEVALVRSIGKTARRLGAAVMGLARWQAKKCEIRSRIGGNNWVWY